jgi:hypothetical protein
MNDKFKKKCLVFCFGALGLSLRRMRSISFYGFLVLRRPAPFNLFTIFFLTRGCPAPLNLRTIFCVHSDTCLRTMSAWSLCGFCAISCTIFVPARSASRPRFFKDSTPTVLVACQNWERNARKIPHKMLPTDDIFVGTLG